MPPPHIARWVRRGLVATAVIVPVVALAIAFALPDPKPYTRLGLVLTIAAVALVGIVAFSLYSWWKLGPRRWWIFGGKARQAQLLEMVDPYLRPGMLGSRVLVRVTHIEQVSRNGTKAIVFVVGRGPSHAFFWHARPSLGDFIVVDGSRGPGTHRDWDVLYIGARGLGHGIVSRLPRSAWRALRRRDAKAARAARRAARTARPSSA